MVIYKLGAQGDDVIEIQQALADLGYYKGIVSGDFDKKTDGAVRGFQKSRGLRADGEVGPKTIEALSTAIKPAAAPTAPAPKPQTAAAPPVIEHVPTASDQFDANGYYVDAIRFDIHPGRLGAKIVAKGAVVHTTDMMPDTFAPLLSAWRKSAGKGNAATFLIGRGPNTAAPDETPNGGVVQMASINRNSNHAGGGSMGVPAHGWVVTPDGAKIHPNSCYVGIEVHAAGRLRKLGTKYEYAASGKVIEPSEVVIDEAGGAWHKLTDYQYEQLAKLLDALDAHCPHLPDGCKIVSHGTHKLCGVSWAAPQSTRFVTHVGLDPARKTDPGRPTDVWIKARYPSATR